MWVLIIIVFLALYSLMCFYVGHRGFSTLSKSALHINKIIYWGFFALIILPFPVSQVLRDILPETFRPWLTIFGWYSVIGVSYISLILLFIDLFRIADKRIGLLHKLFKEHKKTPVVLSAIIVASVIMVLIYGGWNAQNTVVKEYDISIDKKAGSFKELKIAMVSDIHYGANVNAERLNNMVDVINGLQPDLIVLAGDTFEGDLKQEEGRKLSDILGKMEAKYGKFAVPGNHDRVLGNTGGKLYRYFKDAGINVLKDNYVNIENSFYVIGRDDVGYGIGQGRKDIKSIINGVDHSMPLILLDHQPIDIKSAQESGVDLQLSGHTHVGQIFPLNLITGQVYEIDWGLLKKDKYYLIVSSGYGTWGPPIRIGSNSEVVYVKIKFQ